MLRTKAICASIGASALLMALVGTNPAQAVTAPAPPQITSVKTAIMKCNNPGQKVIPTFDDSGSTAQVNSILATLARKNVKGIFFPSGNFASRRPDLIAAIRREGHWLGNHGYSHPSFTTLSDAEVNRQIDLGVRGNVRPSLLRPPYGAGAFSQRLYTLAKARGYQLCYWTVDTRDWDRPTASTIIRRVTVGDASTPPVRPGGSILMHMSGQNTGTALPGMIDAIRARGMVLPQLRS